MVNKKNIAKKIIAFLIIATIFYFLGKNLLLNWGQIKGYKFSLNYLYLLISFIFLIIGFLVRGLTWKKIVNFLQPDNDLSCFEAIRIDLYSQLGRYLPGKVFAVVGKVYLTRNKNISKENLCLGAVFDALFHTIASFILSLFLIGFLFNYKINFLNFYLIGLLAIIGGLLVTSRRAFQYLVKLVLTKIKKELISLDFNLNWSKKAIIIFYYALADFLVGAGFFYLINSLTHLAIENLLSIIGIYVLAGVLGLVVFFAPAGLGIREGVLVLFLKSYFPLNIAILISLLTRVWASFGDISLAGLFYLLKKIKKVTPFWKL